MDGGTRLQSAITLTSGSDHLKNRECHKNAPPGTLASAAAVTESIIIHDKNVFHKGSMPIHSSVAFVLYNHMSTTVMRTISKSLAQAVNVRRKMAWKETLSDLARDIKTAANTSPFPVDLVSMEYYNSAQTATIAGVTSVKALVAKVIEKKIEVDANDKSSFIYLAARRVPSRKGEEADAAHVRVTDSMVEKVFNATTKAVSSLPKKGLGYNLYCEPASLVEDFQDDDDLDLLVPDLPKDSRESKSIIPVVQLFQAILSLLIFVPNSQGLDALIHMLTLPGVDLRVMYHMYRSTVMIKAFVKRMILPNIECELTGSNIQDRYARMVDKYIFQFTVRVFYDMVTVVIEADGISDNVFVSHDVLRSSPFLRHYWRNNWSLPFTDYDEEDSKLVLGDNQGSISYDRDSAMKDPLLLTWIRYLPEFLLALWRTNKRMNYYPIEEIFRSNKSLVGSSSRLFPAGKGYEETAKEMYGFMSSELQLPNIYTLTLKTPDVDKLHGFTITAAAYGKWSKDAIEEKSSEEVHMQRVAQTKRNKRKTAVSTCYAELDNAKAAATDPTKPMEERLAILSQFYSKVQASLPDIVPRPRPQSPKQKKAKKSTEK